METIRKIECGKKEYLELLLEADPSEEMIDRYLEDGTLFVLEEKGEPAAVAVVLPLADGECELKNLAVAQALRGKGYGRRMVEGLFEIYGGAYKRMRVGTADIPCGCKEFYQKLGFRYTHTVNGFFSGNYPEPLYENGALIENMACFAKELK
ncbi:GNAT family N-acetyltransferase [Christensenella tenuis]|uniref:GNAT family N-acetyltransferase n=1 Tax=Christensenella tenuis TaxID=2763033 RepID=A0ABR7ED21_9FIRM|nr:GNAT family N-acetyltransferase [Christensenella tenuis]MBC5647677.1 GNAT family N-acetyltransferase [Christensenella tenuis]